MLKITYIESDLQLEFLQSSLETFVTRRVVLALRLGHQFHLEPSSAAFLLPADLPELPLLKTAIEEEQTDAIAICAVDETYVEVSLRGSWIADEAQAHEGIFLCAIAPQIEQFIFELWQKTQAKVSLS